MEYILYVYIVLSIIFNISLLEINNVTIYLNNILQITLLYLGLFFTIINNNLTKAVDIFVPIIFIYLVFSTKGEISSIVSLLSLCLFLLFYVFFKMLFIVKPEKVMIILLVFVFSIAIKDLVYLFNYDIISLSIHSRINVNNLGNFNNYSYINVLALITIPYLLNKVAFNYIFKRCLIISSFIILFMIIILFSRGGWLCLILISLLYIVFSNKRPRNSSIIKKLLLLLTLSVVMLVLNKSLNIVAKVIERFLTIFEGNGSGRTLIWKHAFLDIQENWGVFKILFGKGLGSFEFEIFGKTITSAHNFFIQIYYEAGLIGLLIFTCMIAIIILKALWISKHDNTTSFFSICIIIIFILSNLIDSHILIVQTNWIYAMYLAFITSCYKLSVESSKNTCHRIK